MLEKISALCHIDWRCGFALSEL